ncbi:50S ribosomal protein L22 [Desulfobacca acetoxidans]|nr:50S ribosomal protein L22 [Desulfobacterales bacterium]
MEIRAQAKFVHVSPQKVRLVTRAIKDKKVDEALGALQFIPKKAARLVRRLVESAVANASQRSQVDVDSLFIKRAYVDGGPSLKRFMSRAMGRVNRIVKRTSHITVVLDEK